MKRCVALAAFCLLSVHTWPDDRGDFSIGPQPLARALNEFAEQWGLQLVYPSKLTAGIDTAGAQGETPDEVLGQLLAGTGLAYEYLNANTITLTPIPTPNTEISTMRETSENNRKPWFRHLAALLAGALLATAPGAEEAEDADAVDDDVETLVVTGTRLPRLPSELSSQVMVLNAAELRDTGEGTLEGALRKLPQNYGGGNEAAPFLTDAPYDRTAFNGTANVFGASTVNLRGVGERGTLVLVNGKRLGMSGLVGGYADVSSIPLDQVERVEIVTDGASAIYGGDAVGGVVNVVLRDDYDGVTASLRHDAPTGGGYRRLSASVAATLGWADGALSGAFTFRDSTTHSVADSPIRHFLEDPYRNYYTAQGTVVGGHDPGGNNQDTPIASLSALVGRDVSSASIPAGQDGTVLTPADFVATAGDPVTADGGYAGYDLSPGRSDYTLRLALRQEFGGVSLASSVRYAPRETTTRRSGTTLALRVPATSPFNPFGENVRVLRANELIRGPTEIRAENENWNLDASLEGGFGDAPARWKWTAEARYARDDGSVTTTNDFAFGAMQFAVSNGSLNPFGATLAVANPPELLAGFVLPTGEFDTLNEETGVSLHVSGPLFTLPAGEVRSVLGVDYREGRLVFSAFRDTQSGVRLVGAGAGLGVFPTDTDQASNAGLDLAGIEGAVRVENTASGLAASRDYRSAFAELRIPVLADLGLLADRVDLNLAVRYEDAESYGAHETWSAGAVWEINPALRLRASRGTSYSTPTLSQAAVPTTLTATVMLDFTRPPFVFFVNNVAGGNALLRPEEADTLGGGLEYTPAFAEGLALSANYSRTDYTNRIDGTIGLFAGIFYNADLDARFPGLYRRDAEDNILGVDSRAVNISEQSSASYDFVADYERETASGTFSVRGNLAVTDRFEQRLSPNDAEATDLLGRWIPQRRYDIRMAWENRGLRVSLGANVTTDLTLEDTIQKSIVTVKHPVLVDLNASYDFEGGLFGTPGRMLGATQLRLGIANLGDKFIERREVSSEDGSPNPNPRRRIPPQIASTGGRTYFVELVKTW